MGNANLSPAAAAEINRLNENLAVLQRKSDNVFGKIGVQYYNLKSENPDPELAEAVAEQKAIENQRKQIEIRIKFLNGIVVCTDCGAENDVKESFCVNCGSKLPHRLAMQDNTHCSNCGNPLKPGQRFCGTCGAPVENPIPEEPVAETVAAPVEEVIEAPAEAVAEAVESAAENAKVCPNCGAAIAEDDTVFCAECGFKVK